MQVTRVPRTLVRGGGVAEVGKGKGARPGPVFTTTVEEMNAFVVLFKVHMVNV